MGLLSWLGLKRREDQTNLDELGFDWLVNPFAASGNDIFAGGGTIGNGQGRTAADFINPVRGALAMAQYLAFRRGPLADPGMSVAAFLKSDPALDHVSSAPS